MDSSYGSVYINAPEQPALMGTGFAVVPAASSIPRRKVAVEAKEELAQLADSAEKVIFEAKGCWPFDFFPDKVTIDVNNVTIIKRYLLNRYTFPIRIKDINNARSNLGPFFGSLEVEIRGYEENPPSLNYLQHGDAVKARNYINALIEAHKNYISLNSLTVSEIVTKLQQISDAKIGGEYHNH